jgi:hypothetical protein
VCRNIETLFNFDPPATEEEIRATTSAPRNREVEAQKARERARARFG